MSTTRLWVERSSTSARKRAPNRGLLKNSHCVGQLVSLNLAMIGRRAGPPGQAKRRQAPLGEAGWFGEGHMHLAGKLARSSMLAVGASLMSAAAFAQAPA